MQFFKQSNFTHLRLVTLSLLLVSATLWAGRALNAVSSHTTTNGQPSEPLAGKQAQLAQLAQLTKRPISFELNRGQAAATTDYLARGAGFSLQLSNTGATVELNRQKASQPPARLKMQLANANLAAQAEGTQPLPGKVNYFHGNDPQHWRTGVPTFGAVKYAGVYPGIDLVWHGNQQQLEYDFIVAPGAVPTDIALTFEGVKTVRIADNGDLVLQTAQGELRQQAPVIWQDIHGARQIVAGRYQIRQPQTATHSAMVGFALEAYDTTQPLVIDPVLSYASFIGGPSTYIANVITDNAGNIVLAGHEERLPGNSASRDFFLLKLNPTATTVLFTTYIGSNGGSSEAYLAVGADNSLFVAGSLVGGGSNFPAVNGFQNGLLSNATVPINGVLTRLSADGGTILYSTYVSDGNTTRVQGLAVRGLTAYLCGQLTPNGSETVIGLFSVDTNKTGAASLLNVQKLNGLAVTAETMDAAGMVYLGGFVRAGYAAVTPGAVDLRRGSLHPNATLTFLAKIDPALPVPQAIQYLANLGGNNYTWITALASNSAGEVYATGTTLSKDWQTTTNAFQPSHGKDEETINQAYYSAFLLKLSADGRALPYLSYLGGNGQSDRGLAVETVGEHQVWVAGSTTSRNFPTTADALQSEFKGTSEIPKNGFVSFFDTSRAGTASLLFASYFGSADTEVKDLTRTAQGHLLLTGTTTALDFPLTGDAVKNTPGGAFLVRLHNTGTPAPTQTPVFTPTPTPSATTTPTPTPDVPGFKISGRVTDKDGAGLSGIVITITRLENGQEIPDSASRTLTNGIYLASGESGKSYRVSAPRTGLIIGGVSYFAEPASVTLNNLSADQVVNFAYTRTATASPTPNVTPTPAPTATPTPAPTPTPETAMLVSITGQLVDRNGKGLSNQLVTLTGNAVSNTFTDRNGYFALTGLRAGGDYRVTPPPSGPRVNFTTFYPNPGWAEFKNLRANQQVVIRYDLTTPWVPPNATPTPTPTPLPTPTPPVTTGSDGALVNPNFELGGFGWLTGGAVSFVNGSARLAPVNSFAPASLLQWVKLTPGATYEITLSAITSATARTTLSVRFDDGAAGPVQIIPAGQTRPTTAVLRFTMPANATQAGVYVQVNGALANNSWAQLDNFWLTRSN